MFIGNTSWKVNIGKVTIGKHCSDGRCFYYCPWLNLVSVRSKEYMNTVLYPRSTNKVKIWFCRCGYFDILCSECSRCFWVLKSMSSERHISMLSVQWQDQAYDFFSDQKIFFVCNTISPLKMWLFLKTFFQSVFPIVRLFLALNLT